MMGREQNLPLDIMFCSPPRHDARYACATEYVEWLRRGIQKAHEYARAHTRVAASRQKRNYDARCRPINYERGQYVWRWVPPGGSKKLARGWHGPFRIMDQATDINCYIQLTPESRTVRVHVDSLKPHLGRVPLVWRRYEEAEQDVSENSSSGSEEPCSSGEDTNAEVDPPDSTASGAAEAGKDLPRTGPASPSEDEEPRRGGRFRKPPARLDL